MSSNPANSHSKSRWQWIGLTLLWLCGISLLLAVLISVIPTLNEISALRHWLKEYALWLFIPRIAIYGASLIIAARLIFGRNWFQDARRCRRIGLTGIGLMILIEVGLVQGGLKALFNVLFDVTRN